MTPYRQWFRIDHVQTPLARSAADGAFHLIVTAPNHPRGVELLLSDFFGQHGLIGMDYGDMIEATASRDATAYGRAEIICSLSEAEGEIKVFRTRALARRPAALLLMLIKSADQPGENILVDLDRLAQPLESLAIPLLYQCDIRPLHIDNQFLLVSVTNRGDA